MYSFLSLISIWDQAQEAQVRLVSCFPLSSRSRQETFTKQGPETICLPAGMGWLLQPGIDRLKCSNKTHPQVLEKHREPDTHLESKPWLCPRTENVRKSIKNRAEVGC